jgi:hypothetical protein
VSRKTLNEHLCSLINQQKNQILAVYHGARNAR